MAQVLPWDKAGLTSHLDSSVEVIPPSQGLRNSENSGQAHGTWLGTQLGRATRGGRAAAGSLQSTSSWSAFWVCDLKQVISLLGFTVSAAEVIKPQDTPNQPGAKDTGEEASGLSPKEQVEVGWPRGGDSGWLLAPDAGGRRGGRTDHSWAPWRLESSEDRNRRGGKHPVDPHQHRPPRGHHLPPCPAPLGAGAVRWAGEEPRPLAMPLPKPRPLPASWSGPPWGGEAAGPRAAVQRQVSAARRSQGPQVICTGLFAGRESGELLVLSGMGSLRSLRTEPPIPVGSGTTTQEVLPASLRQRHGHLQNQCSPWVVCFFPGGEFSV